MWRVGLVMALLTICTEVYAQVADDFGDGDFFVNPTWTSSQLTGTHDFFVNSSFELQSTGPGSNGPNVIHITTENSPNYNQYVVGWKFKVHYNHSSGGSNSNRIEVFLIADTEDLDESPSGYFVQLGESGSGDGIDLYKTSSNTPIINDKNDLIAEGIDVAVEVSRLPGGQWKLKAEVDGGPLQNIGQGEDSEFTEGTHFGFRVKHSNSRNDAFFFDDIEISLTDTFPPTVSEVVALSVSSIRVTFSEPVDAISSGNTENYVIYGIGVVAVEPGNSPDEVLLTVSGLTNGLSYELVVNRVEDLNSQIITANTRVPFDYIEYAQPDHRDIVINEFIVDPDAGGSLPDAEFVELYNPTFNYFSLADFIIEEKTSSGVIESSDPLGDYTLEPDQYVIICDIDEQDKFDAYLNVIPVGNLPDFNQRNSSITLKNDLNEEIDRISYEAGVPLDGISFEQVNPYLPCSGQFNFAPSSDHSGGTPGLQNSVFNDSPDLVKPVVNQVIVIDADSLQVIFSEPLKAASISTSAFAIVGFSISQAELIDPSTVAISLSSDLVSETNYELSFEGLEDCSGNEILKGSEKFNYDISPPVLNRLLVTSSNAIFLIFNEPVQRPSSADLENLVIDKGIGFPERVMLQDTAEHRLLLEFSSSFEAGETYDFQYGGIQDLSDNFISEGTRSFVYRNDIDTAFFISGNILEIEFTRPTNVIDATHSGNYWMPELGRPSEVVDLGNKRNFRLIFLEKASKNKPLNLYVEGVKEDGKSDLLVTPAFVLIYDTDPPEAVGLIALSENELLLIFNEGLDPSSAKNLGSYELNESIIPVAVRQVENEVTLKFSTKFEEESELNLTYSDIRDLYGNAFKTKREISITYDIKPPAIDSVFLFDERIVAVYPSEQVDRSSLNASNFLVGGIAASSFEFFEYANSPVLLRFSQPVGVSASQKLEVRQWRDEWGNGLENPITRNFDTKNPRMAELKILNDSTVQISFNKKMAPSAFDARNYKLEEEEILKVEKVNDFTSRVYLRRYFKDEQSYLLIATGLQDLEGNNLQFNEVVFSFETFLESVIFVDSRTLELWYEKALSGINTSNFMVDGVTPSAAVLLEEGKVVQLSFAEPFKENEGLRLVWKELRDKYARTLPDHATIISYDTKPPEISKVISRLDNSIEIFFNEAIELSTLSVPEQILILDLGNPIFLGNSFEKSVIAFFEEELIAGTAYTLIVQDFSDIKGNFQDVDTIAFTYRLPEEIPFGALKLSELMINPDTLTGLPEAEYIELFNATEEVINLDLLTLSDLVSTTELPDYELRGNSYVVLADVEDSQLFDSIQVITGKDSLEILFVENLITLNNDEDFITLASFNGAPIDDVNYNVDWYNDRVKQEGGYSLELINPFSTCSGSVNWTASHDSTGGTPGFENSVFSDSLENASPALLGANFVEDTLEVIFSEEMDEALISPEGFFLTGGEIVEANLLEDGITVQLILAEAGTIGELYELQILGVSDCSGNILTETSLLVGIGETADFNDILVTEIMADPAPQVQLPEEEYIEIFNRSDRLLSLDSTFLVNGNDTSGFLSGIIQAGQYLVITSESAVAEFESKSVIGVGNWPALNNAGESVTLVSKSNLVFKVTYSSSWHDDSKTAGGYSLEMKDLNNPCGGSENWGSSESDRGGTPGELNSLIDLVPDNFGPELEASVAVASDTIRLVFSEPLSRENPPDVEINNNITIFEYIFTSEPTEVLAVINPGLEQGLEYQVSLINARDCLGNNSADAESTLLVLPFEAETDEILLSEILFDPNPGGFDFVEVYNDSEEYLTIDGWYLSNGDERIQIHQETILAPNGYLAFTEDAERLKADYPSAVSENLIVVPKLPALPNEGGSISIQGESAIVDSLQYEEEFHSTLLEETEGVSLERISFDSPNNKENWTSASRFLEYATPGYRNSQGLNLPTLENPLTVEPKVFVPGGANALTTINYKFDRAGLFANVYLYDQNGRLVKNLVQGMPVVNGELLTWDGTNNSGSIVRMGYYLVVFETYGPTVSNKIFTETVVVGRDF